MTTGQLELPLFADEHEQVRQMELRTYSCGVKRELHPPHERADGLSCPGLTCLRCARQGPHAHHRWWSIPDAFYWCNGISMHRLGGRAIEDVELP